MKKEFLVLLMIAGSVMFLSAEGKQDNDDVQYYGRGPGMMGGYRYSDEDAAKWIEDRDAARQEYFDSLDTVSVTGALSLVNGELPYIESEGTKYTVMAPWAYLDDLELTDGMNVSLEGYLMPGPPLQWDDAEQTLMVTKAVINGEEIEIDHPMDGSAYGGPMAGRGGFGGNMGGRGSRGGAMMGGRRFQ
ncbi:hypothetical protein [Spirochaeta isovalerica]|uniref:Uncharacterized protein n=1 Tax=Spirochaeta isovalerica TaxID=150 RepID=A0A841RGN3_9SPIO|nr:hypothetical protein [Spirochaeta isovalerica]MBB6481668.1 hypothetical protein [Spirochaeta isovalerica]